MTSPLRDALSLADYVPYRQLNVGTNYMIYIRNTFGGNRRIRITQSLGGQVQQLSLPDVPIADLNNVTLGIDPVENELVVCLLDNPTATVDPITCDGATPSTNCFSLFGFHDVYIDNVRVVQNASPAKIVEYFDATDGVDLQIEFCPQCDVPRNAAIIFTSFSGEWDWYINGKLYKSGNINTWQEEPTDTYGLYFSGDDLSLPEEFRNTYTIMQSMNDLIVGRSNMLLVPKNNASTYAFHPIMDESELDTLSFHSNGGIGWCHDPTIGYESGACENGTSYIVLPFPLSGPEYDGTIALSRPDFGQVELSFPDTITPTQLSNLINAQALPNVFVVAKSDGYLGDRIEITNNSPTLNLSLMLDGLCPIDMDNFGNPSAYFNADILTACLMPDYSNGLDGFKMKIVNTGAGSSRVRFTPKNGFSVMYSGDNPTHGYIDSDMVVCISGVSNGDCVPSSLRGTSEVLEEANMFVLSYTIDDGPIATVSGVDLQAIALALHESQLFPEGLELGEEYYGHFNITALNEVLIIAGYGIVDNEWGLYEYTFDGVGSQWITNFNAFNGEFVAMPRTLKLVPTPFVAPDSRDLLMESMFDDPLVTAHACGYLSAFAG